MAIFNTVYGGEWKWKPWANTLVYYNFDDNWANWYVTDMSWNWHNLTSWTQPTYEQLTSWKYCWVSDWSARVYWSSFSATSDEFTLLYYINITNLSQAGKFWLMFKWNENFSALYGTGYNPNLTVWNTAWATGIVGWLNPTVNTWYHFCVVGNKTENTCKVYVNWTLSGTDTYNQSWWTLQIYLFGSNAWDNCKCKLDEVILENKAWSLDEITKYYNSTKANYS